MAPGAGNTHATEMWQSFYCKRKVVSMPILFLSVFHLKDHRFPQASTHLSEQDSLTVQTGTVDD